MCSLEPRKVFSYTAFALFFASVACHAATPTDAQLQALVSQAVTPIMQQNNITQLVVLDGREVAGFIHLHDLLKEGIV